MTFSTHISSVAINTIAYQANWMNIDFTAVKNVFTLIMLKRIDGMIRFHTLSVFIVIRIVINSRSFSKHCSSLCLRCFHSALSSLLLTRESHTSLYSFSLMGVFSAIRLILTTTPMVIGELYTICSFENKFTKSAWKMSICVSTHVCLMRVILIDQYRWMLNKILVLIRYNHIIRTQISYLSILVFTLTIFWYLI